MKTSSEITNDIISFYSKIQNKITNFGPVSVTRSLFYSFAVQLEELYIQLDTVSRQSYIVTATGKYLDRLVFGTFGLSRRAPTRASGYVVLYGNSPISSVSEIELEAAVYNPKTNALSFDQTATRFITSGSSGVGGKVFVLTLPKNPEAWYQAENGKFYIKVPDRQVQFLILPVASTVNGEESNVPEGSITVYPSPPSGIVGVVNTYNPEEVFFTSPAQYEAPFDTRFTKIRDFNLVNNQEDSGFSVVNAYNFSQTGILNFEDSKGNLYMGEWVKLTDSDAVDFTAPVLQYPLQLEYKQVQTNLVVLETPIGKNRASFEDSLAEVPVITRFDTDGNPMRYKLSKIYYRGRLAKDLRLNYVVGVLSSDFPGVRLFTYLREISTNLLNELVVRQVKADFDLNLVFDPDKVMTIDGTIVDSARIGGAADTEDDPEYREALQRYLSTLARATPNALEAGALQVPGITFAKTIPTSARGTALLLVSSEDGIVPPDTVLNVRTLLEPAWKAAGINLIVKTPEPVNLTVSMTLTVRVNYLKEQVEEAVKFAIRQFFISKEPGTVISYSELISVVQNVEGVLNVWNLYVGRLMDSNIFNVRRIRNSEIADTPRFYGYIGKVIEEAYRNQSPLLHTHLEKSLVATNKIVTLRSTYGTEAVRNAYTPTQLVKKVELTPVTADRYNAVDFPDALWDEFTANLFEINNAQDFMQFVIANRRSIFHGHSNSDILYKLSWIFAQPIDTADSFLHSVSPVDAKSLTVDNLKDTKLAEFETPTESYIRIDRQTTVLIGMETVLEGTNS